MQKAERTFDPQTGRVLPDLTKGKTMTIDTENGKAAKKKGERIKIVYLNEKGEEFSSPPEGITAIKAKLPRLGEEVSLDLASLPKEIINRLALHGAAVLGRNAVNTQPEDEDEEGFADLQARWAGFQAGTYRSLSTGSATPLILLALERALLESGQFTPETASAKVSEYRALYDAGETDEEQKKSRREVSAALRKKNPVRAAESAIKAERAEKRAANTKGSDDLSDI